MDEKPRIGMVGAGKVGSVLARLSVQVGYTVSAVSSLHRASAEKLAAETGASVVSSAVETAALADLILLTVPDDAIAQVAGQVAQVSLAGKAVVHTAGALDTGVLQAAAKAGAMVGSWHPAQAFAAANRAGLTGVAFAVETGDARLREWLLNLTAAFGGHPLMIPPGGKVVYHAALVFVSNYTVGLYAVAGRLLTGLGLDDASVAAALNPLLTGTVTNIQQYGIPDALTGPLTRGDAGTVAAHLQALGDCDERLQALYKLLAQVTLPVAMAKEPDRDFEPLGAILDERNDHADQRA